nr:VC0807 family protein [Ktedonobacteraceae bacterium]
MSETKSPLGPSRMNIRSFLPSILINGAVPLAIYLILKHYNYSDLMALSASVLFPVIGSVMSIVRQRTLDLIAAIALMGIVVSIIAVFLGGDPKILLIRESFITGALGIACFVSLLFPRPLMFYFGRYFATANDPAGRARYNELWQYPYFRFVNRVITVVWGVAYAGEFILRIILVYTLPIAVVLAVSPIILGGLTILTIAWTFAYARRAGRRGAEMD